LVQTTGYEYIDLPTDHITQQIYVKCLYATRPFADLLSEFKLSEDNDKRIPLDIPVDPLLNEVIEQWGLVMETAYLTGVTGVTAFYAMPSDIGYGVYAPYGAADAGTVWSTDGGQWQYLGTSTGIHHKALLFGALPHGVMPMLPKPGKEIADWYDVTKLGSLRLRTKDAASTADVATAEIITTQYRPY